MKVNFDSDYLWICHKNIMGCDVIPYYILNISIILIMVALIIGIIIGYWSNK